MSRPKRAEPLPTTTLTASSRSTFIRCRRRYYYSYERRLSPKGLTVPFVVGGLFHKVLEHWYTTPRDKRPSLPAAMRMINEGVRKARAEAIGSERQLEYLETGHSTLIGIARAYHSMYLEEDRRRWVVRAAEVPFEFPLGFGGWVGAGKIDLVVEIKGKVWFVEHKTTSVLGEDYVGRLPLDDQIHQYFLGAAAALGVKPQGVIYNVVQKSRLRQKKDESFEQLCARVESDYLADPSRYFWRGVLKLPDWSLKRYKESMPVIASAIDATRAMSRDVERLGGDPRAPWYMNTHHCYQFGACPFVSLCTTNEDPGAMLSFTKRKDFHPELETEEEA